MSDRTVRILHRPSGTLIAEGRVGWEVKPFEGNWYISRSALRTDAFRTTPLPGLCPYKFIYLWLDFVPESGPPSRRLGWRYVVPNPLFPFIAFRVAVPGSHPDLEIDVRVADEAHTHG
ncbi:MAG: hypothetical protein RQ745_01465 [Longimicrobiales bacterium]|nr:hypothetical protein [Longimicrobiales bacterium]